MCQRLTAVFAIIVLSAALVAEERVLRVSVVDPPAGLELGSRLALEVTLQDRVDGIQVAQIVTRARVVTGGYGTEFQSDPSLSGVGWELFLDQDDAPSGSLGTFAYGPVSVLEIAYSGGFIQLVLDGPPGVPVGGLPDSMEAADWTVRSYITPVGSASTSSLVPLELSLTPPLGACCVGEHCIDVTAEDCDGAGGTFLGAQTSCERGACVIGAFCSLADAAHCATSGGTFAGAGTTCSGATLCDAVCRTDLNDDEISDVLDLLQYLAVWFGGCP